MCTERNLYATSKAPATDIAVDAAFEKSCNYNELKQAPLNNEQQRKLFKAIGHKIYGVVLIDILADEVEILQNVLYPKTIGMKMSWKKYVEAYTRIVGEDLLNAISSKSLLSRLQAGEERFGESFSYKLDDAVERYIMVDVQMWYEENRPTASLVITQNRVEHLRQTIINWYVYDECDYFIKLDAKNNRYEMFSFSSNGTPLPAAVCEDYEAELVDYAKKYVVPEDVEYVISEMRIPRILEALEYKDVHTFTCGIIDEQRGYTRKRLRYRYYNKEQQIILLSRSDITDIYFERQEQRSKLQAALNSARVDKMTGLLNRDSMVNMVNTYMKDSLAKAALLFIDLDNFKSVNDTYGHLKGDELICGVADVLSNACDEALVGRIGGDEFLIFMRNIKSSSQVEEYAQALCDKICELASDFGVNVSCSIGVALAPEQGNNYEALVDHADKLVYQAKKSGKNQYKM